MRLFVAVPVSTQAQEEILAAVGPWRTDDRVSWTRPSGWHLTVAFLGEVDDDLLDPVVDAVRVGSRDAGVGVPLTLTTDGVTTLGRGALAVEVDDRPSGSLERLGQSVQDALAGAELPVTRRPVHPHLTLGRARRRRPVPRDLVEAVSVPEVRWTATDVHVVQSVLGSGPATYRSRATVALPDR